MNPLASLDPKKRRMVIVAGIAGLLALMVMLSRRGAGPAEEAPATEDVGSADASDPNASLSNSAGTPGSYDFAGAGDDAYLGQFGSSVTDALGGVQQAVSAAHLGRFPKQVSSLRHQHQKDRARIRKLEHRIDQRRGQHHGNGGGKGGNAGHHGNGGHGGHGTAGGHGGR